MAASQLQANNPYRNPNPYTGGVPSYRESGWQGFLRAIGFRTGADAWKENMAIQASEYDAALAQKEYDENYNLPIHQVARMRAAGINPDLNGGDGIDAGSAAPLGEDPSTPMQSQGDEGQLMNFANGVLGCFSSAIGLVGSIQGIQRNRLQNDLSAMQNESFMADFAKGMFPYFLPTSPENLVNEDGSEISWQMQALERAQAFAGKLPKNMRSKFLSQVQGYWNSAPGNADAYKEWYERVNSRKGYFNESSYFYDDADSVLRIISDELQDTNERIYKLQQKASQTDASADIAENENREEYAETLDAGLQASAENAENRVNKANNEMVGVMRESLNRMIQKLDEASKHSGVKGGLASVAMAMLSAFQLYISSQGMPGVSRSNSFSDSQYHGPSHSQSSGWSLNL